MTIFLLIVIISGVPMGAQYATRDECEDAALRVWASVSDVQNTKVECVERAKK